MKEHFGVYFFVISIFLEPGMCNLMACPNELCQTKNSDCECVPDKAKKHREECKGTGTRIPGKDNDRWRTGKLQGIFGLHFSVI